MTEREITGGLVLVIVDSPVTGDNRVQRSIAASEYPVAVLDIRDQTVAAARLHTFLIVVFTLSRALWGAGGRYRLLSERLSGRVSGNFFSGMKACIRWMACASRASQAITKRSSEEEIRVVHAHDLYCAVAAVLAKRPQGIRLIYDAHELEIHRNRKAGWLRILLEHGLEKLVLRRVSEVRVVNHAIAKVMQQWYEMPPIIRVEYNDLYDHHPTTVPSAVEGPAFVYVGKWVQGRQLELLDRPPGDLGFDVHVFLLGAKLPTHIQGRSWHHGPLDYEEHLLKLARAKRCLMWCCLDATCLSYQLATPNKFFQAMAVGIPVVASRGTYLAEIVEKYEIGAVFDGDNLQDIAEKVMSPVFEKWVAGIAAFRADLRSGRVVI